MKVFNGKKTIIKIFCAILAILLLPIAYTHTYWGIFSQTNSSLELEVEVADFPFGSQNPIDRLPSSVPQYIIDRLEDISIYADESELEKLSDVIAQIVDYPPFQEQINVVIATSIEGLFNDYMQPLNGGDFLIYLTEIDGKLEVALVHISENSPLYSTAEQLILALSQPWTGYNKISNVWLRGNLYDTFNSPLEYEDNVYLMNYNGPSGTPPNLDSETWFKVPKNYEYNQINRRYYQNYITKHEEVFYIASQTAWANIPTQNGWSPWNVIEMWQNGVNYMPHSVVMTQNNGEYRFFRALRSARNIEPNEVSARAGFWQEINNGWIGRSGETDIKSYYFEHNTYQTGTTIIYGVSPKMKYSYYTAITDVPSDEPPIKRDSDGINRLNSQFWEVYQ